VAVRSSSWRAKCGCWCRYKVKELFADFDQFPFQTDSTLNAGDVGYGLLQQQAALKRLTELESWRRVDALLLSYLQ
jgi:hypothetical protein